MDAKIALKFFNSSIIFFVLLFFVINVINAEPGSFSDSNFASKRRQTTTGLIPFPRVGRSSKGKSWQLRASEQIKRREGLIPFPRVGRSGSSYVGRLSDIPVTWLASRANKDFQRTYPDLYDQWILSALENYKPTNEINEEDDEYLSKFHQNQINDESLYSDDGKKENLELLFKK